ncbi:Calcium-transporting P-type ATPase [Trema orientale]|uniref:Calcium-transporting P-type ATPase n=1 Tax=Trema orientale TaxID=63057 RepID=A0A2P5EDN1_TREOI|nr:Calcium-transporting P-type ATPase [Trema orientale]
MASRGSTSSSNGLLPGATQPDLEAGKECHHSEFEEDDDAASSEDPFDIANTKNAPHETLKRWRQAALVLNASRRFRYTLDLKKEEEKENRRRMIRSHAQVIRAALLFKMAGERQIVLGPTVAPPTPSGDYAIGLERLASLTRDHDIATLQQYGGAKGLSTMLKTNVEKGIDGDENDLIKRRNAFGSNTYPRKKGRSFLRFLWEAWQDLTLIILIIAAVVSLVLGIKTELLAIIDNHFNFRI